MAALVLLVRIRKHLFLPRGHAHRRAGRCGGRSRALAPLSARADLQGAWLERLSVHAAKGRYMWRDLARICEAEGLALKLPPVRFPQNGLKAARLALVGETDGWTPSFTRAVFVANYAEQKDISDDATLTAILAALDVDADPAFAAANAPETKEALKAQTAQAELRGLFGAPSFTVGDELFWGNDRLETALAWAKTRSKD